MSADAQHIQYPFCVLARGIGENHHLLRYGSQHRVQLGIRLQVLVQPDLVHVQQVLVRVDLVVYLQAAHGGAIVLQVALPERVRFFIREVKPCLDKVQDQTSDLPHDARAAGIDSVVQVE